MAGTHTMFRTKSIDRLMAESRATGEGTLLVSSEGRQAPAYEVALPDLDSPDEPTAPSTISREGRELPEEPGSGPDSRPWLIGLGLGAVSLVVLWLSLRSPPHHPR